jgi:hypothetical protein
MISINNETQNLVIASVLGEFNLADFQELEKAAEHALRLQGSTNLLVDLRDMLGFTVDVAWEEIRFARQHPRDFGRIAVVTEDQWLQWSAWLTRLFTEADVRVFDDYEAAQAWLQTPG